MLYCHQFELFPLFLIGKTIFLKSAVAHSLFLMHCDRCWLDCWVANGELTFKAYIPQSFRTYFEFKLQWAERLLYITQSDFEHQRELCLMNCSKPRLPWNTTAVRREQSELRQFHNTRCCDGSNARGRNRRVFVIGRLYQKWRVLISPCFIHAVPKKYWMPLGWPSYSN